MWDLGGRFRAWGLGLRCLAQQGRRPWRGHLQVMAEPVKAKA